MDSPKSTHSDGSDSGRVTPKPSRRFYWPKISDSSPLIHPPPERDEVIWEDSPERPPLPCIEPPVPPPRKVEQETPKSHSKKRSSRHRRSRISPEVMEKELANIKKMMEDFNKNCAPAIIETSGLSMSSLKHKTEAEQSTSETATSQSSDADKLSFFDDDEGDALLSQIDMSDIARTPNRGGKGTFSKSLSDNQLDSPSSSKSSGFRRSSSFQTNSTNARISIQFGDSKLETCGYSNHKRPSEDAPAPIKKQKSFHIDLPSSHTENMTPAAIIKFTPEQIEQNRLAAIFKRKKGEIEKRRLEALKKMKERQNSRQTNSQIR